MKKSGGQQSGVNLKQSPGNEVKVVWTCDGKSEAQCGKEGDMTGSTGGMAEECLRD